MSGDSNFSTIIGQLTELSGTMGRVEGKLSALEESIKDLRREDARQNEQLNHQNDLLAEHIQGVKTNTRRLEEEKMARMEVNKVHDNKDEDYEKRLKALEKDPEFKSELKKRLLWVAAICGALITIWQFIEMF